MKRLFRLVALIIVIILTAANGVPVIADDVKGMSHAGICEELGILKGSGSGLTAGYLASVPTRMQGAIMLLRLLGREEEAKSYILSEGAENFKDAYQVSPENRTILAYLKANPGIGLEGTGNNLFNPMAKMTAAQYQKIILVALGCSDGSPGDFTKDGLSRFASSREIIVATDRSPLEWREKAQFICTRGVIPNALRTAIKLGNGIFRFAPGEYLIEGPLGSLYLGSNTTIMGCSKIMQPEKLEEMLYPNAATQAVFITRTALPSTVECNDLQAGFIRTAPGAENVTISDIALSGYTALILDSASKSLVSNVLIHNYRGTYPKGQWCNMGYGRATASLWLYGNCSDIKISNCQIQCSSHHGLAIHTGSSEFLTRNVRITGTRALYCGNGQLRGETGAYHNEAAIRVPETKGFGYYDWSVAFDLCENQSVENVMVEDCYALEGWKAGFYTEPESSGGHIKNLSLIRCRSELSGQRALIPNSRPRATIPQETEGSNYYMQGGYFEDCISVKGEKSGWYLMPDRTDANPTGDGVIKMVRCGDLGSPISLVTEMFASSGLHCEGFWSLNATGHAMWLFGTTDFKLENTLILTSNTLYSPIKIGYMLRQQFRESRSPQNQKAVAPNGKYDSLRANFTDSRITGTIYNLPEGKNPVEIVSGATFNGSGDVTRDDIGITLENKSGNSIKIEDYVAPGVVNPVASDIRPVPAAEFTMNELAEATVKGLKMEMKDGSRTLIGRLVAAGAISEAAAIRSLLYLPRGMDKSAVYMPRDEKSGWKNFGYSLGAYNTGKHNIHFDLTPTRADAEGFIGLADSETKVEAAGDCAILLKLMAGGYFGTESRTGNPQNRGSIAYAAGMSYHIEIQADMNNEIYSIFVTPPGGERTELAGNESIHGEEMDDLGQLFLVSGKGSGCFKVQNFYMTTVR